MDLGIMRTQDFSMELDFQELIKSTIYSYFSPS